LIQSIKLLESISENKIYSWGLTTKNPQRQFSVQMKRKKDLKVVKIMYTDFITKEMCL
jgi:hypothetical protein